MLALVIAFALMVQEACSDCGKPLKEGAKFCSECGVKVQPAKCPGCGAEVGPKEKFCSACGRALQPGKGDDPFADGARALAEAMPFLYVSAPSGLGEKLKKAESLLQGGVRKSPQSATGHFLLGRVYELQGRFEEAEVSWRKAVDLDPKLLSAQALLGRLLMTRAWLDPDRDQDRKEWIRLLRAGEEADDPLARVECRTWVAALEGNPEEARRAAKEAIMRFGAQPGVEDFYWILAKAAQRPEEQLEAYSRALERRPHFALANLGRGEAYFRLGHWEEAVADFTLAIQGNLQAVLVLRAKTHAAAGKLEEATADLDQFLRLNPQSSYALVERASVRLRRGDLAGALVDCSSALRIRPQCVPAFVLRGVVRMRQGDVEGALGDWDCAIESDPECVEARLNRANAHVALGRLEEAIRGFDEVIRRMPTSVGAYLGRARVNASLGDLDSAIADYCRAIELDPRCADGFAGRGVIFVQRGDRDRAVADFERALEVAPKDWPHRASVEKKLKELRK